MNELKSIKNFALLDLLQVVCSKSDSKLLKEQISNLADLLVQNVLLDQHFVDNQWPSSSLGDLDDNLENELEAIKLFIERQPLKTKSFNFKFKIKNKMFKIFKGHGSSKYCRESCR